MKKTRAERLEIYLRYLKDAEPVGSSEDALELICRTLDEVEEEYTDDPNEPERWRELDRMFPPQSDRIALESPRPGITTVVTRGHEIYIGDNGSFEIRRRGKTKDDSTPIIEMFKPGADGKGLPS